MKALALALFVCSASLTTPALADVVKGTQCHPDSPIGFCCPNDGKASGPYCPARPIKANTGGTNTSQPVPKAVLLRLQPTSDR
jgi:hypothetical protein